MATVVLDLELEQLPSEITMPRKYHWAYILVRLRGRPVGQVCVPVVGGRLGGIELHQRLIRAGNWPLWEHWLREKLDFDELSTGTSLPSATVAVCTRDRPDDLQNCVNALLQLPDDGQELLVIDNCPATDATRQIVANCGDRVRYVREDRPGLDCARNRALREARHEVVAFIDDDATADRDWLRALLRNFDERLVMCVTGLTMPIELETRAQEWFEHYSGFCRGFERIVYDRYIIDPLAAGRVGAGANMAVRRSVLECVGPFDEALDAGTLTCSGGDTEMFSRILRHGYRIVYTPAALNWHRHRRTWEELRKAVYGYGVGVYAFWSRCLLFERELGIPKAAWNWFWHGQLPTLVHSLRKGANRHYRSRAWTAQKAVPIDLLLAELRGCLAGPQAYLSARKRSRQGQDRSVDEKTLAIPIPSTEC